MFIADLANAGAMPTLGAVLSFAGQRQRVLAHNVANLETPDYRPMDVSVSAFHAQLAQAVRDRRSRTGGEHGELRLTATDEVSQDARGAIHLTPGTASGNILYHDRNNRDPERLMQAIAENQLMFRVATDLYRRQADILRVAISQRA